MPLYKSAGATVLMNLSYDMLLCMCVHSCAWLVLVHSQRCLTALTRPSVSLETRAYGP